MMSCFIFFAIAGSTDLVWGLFVVTDEILLLETKSNVSNVLLRSLCGLRSFNNDLDGLLKEFNDAKG